MCNPRHVRVRAAMHLAEAWNQEVRRQVTLHGAATGRASVRESLAGSLGVPVLSALDRVLDGLEGWQAQDGDYRYDLDGGYVLYHADTGELEIVAELTSEITAEGTAGTTVSGRVDENVEVEGTGRYYDDNWGGYTEETARRDAEANASRNLEDAAAERLAQARAEVEGRVAATVEAQARAAAQAALADLTTAQIAELERRAEQQLTTVGVQGRRVFHQALAQAYRDAILAYARSRHAEGVRLSGSEGVLDIEFEMEI